MSQFGEIVKQVSSSFREPEYIDAKIRYVERKEDADVCVSENHTMSDYIVLGAFALLNSVTEKKPEIKVFQEKLLAKETIGVWAGSRPYKSVSVESELFLQMSKPLDTIYNILYQGEYKFFGVGLTMTVLLMTQMTDTVVIPEEIIKDVVFENFDDMETAQRNVFMLLKRMTTLICD